jgi:hypothetical protein
LVVVFDLSQTGKGEDARGGGGGDHGVERDWDNRLVEAAGLKSEGKNSGGIMVETSVGILARRGLRKGRREF